MNSLLNVRPSPSPAASMADLPFTAWEPPAEPSSAPAPAPALITRRSLPGTSIRRLRNHRSAWPRRA